MHKKDLKITKTKDFDKIFKQGISSFSPTLLIKRQKNNLGVNRYGVIVSTKVSPKAVVRNKIKRLIREVFKQEKTKLSQGNDLIFIAQKDIKDKLYQEVLASVQKQFKKINIYQ